MWYEKGLLKKINNFLPIFRVPSYTTILYHSSFEILTPFLIIKLLYSILTILAPDYDIQFETQANVSFLPCRHQSEHLHDAL